MASGAVMVDLGVIAAGGVVVWFAGTRLSRDADDLAAATGVGRVLVGALLLGVVTSLPELAVTVTAGFVGNPRLAVGNLMGGVALQVVVLAVADIIESKRRLTFQVSSPAVLVQHVMLVLLLTLALAGMVIGEPFSLGGLGLWPLLLAGVYGFSLIQVRRAERDEAWEVADGGPSIGRGAEPDRSDAADAGISRPPAWRLVALGAVVLVAGWFVARAGDSLAEGELLSGTFVGAALVALTTSLPELSTVLGSLRRGAYDMAVANIAGTNGLEVALLVVADAAYRDGPILASVGQGDRFLTALAAVLTCIYLAGLLLRRERAVLRVGRDSLLVLVTYALGLIVLAAAG